ncbi:Replicase polyprotein 1ab [Actinoplanes sp. SE50]|uniref:Replicase polyprotein 1ab n=1 Tax=unclassified Actinoplanes TaxID=2626549 RepID=UPI00023EC783|nr:MULTISPECIES: Replicase polyprotein 1ab [unclassified Actinoplanes]AEV83661.1 Replicase polyprotein 1ab [Actinoplanes sp. SE50/110]ATO82195.1 Replicase polyprotein 1ab [Actinoplanes sp. SE50]SLL99602.1 hypothetical protein ACSP50_2833 [Actinoplanes sp. SE50/110]
MVDIGWVRRMDAITGGAIVLTVDAVIFLMTALVGAPLLLFFMADDEGAGPLWPYATVWGVSAVLGAGSAAVAYLIGDRGTRGIRQIGASIALTTAVATGALVVGAIESSPVLAMVSALFAAANVGAVKMLLGPEPVEAGPPALPNTFLLAAPLAEAEFRTRETVEIQVRPAPAIASGDTEAPAIVSGDTEAPAIVSGDTEAPAIVSGDTEAPAIVSADTEASATASADTESAAGERRDEKTGAGETTRTESQTGLAAFSGTIDAGLADVDAAGGESDSEVAEAESVDVTSPARRIVGRDPRIRPRGSAAMHTMGGVRLPPRATRRRS